MYAQSTEQSQDIEQQGTQHWAVWSVYARDNDRTVPTHEQETAAVQEFDALVEQLAAEGVVQILRNDTRGDAAPVMADQQNALRIAIHSFGAGFLGASRYK